MSVALITGVGGQDGSYLSERLLGEGMDVHGTVLDTASENETRFVPAGVRIHAGDLAEPGSVAELIRALEPDEIYNLGGVSSVAQSWEDPLTTGRVNGTGAAAVFEAAWELQRRTGRGVRVLQASSGEIFGSPKDSPQTEATPIAPVSPYGAAKAYAHFMVEAYRAKGLFAVACILYNHESPRRPLSFVTRKITAGAALIAERGGGVLRLGNLDARRDWGWAPDYVDAMVRAVRHPEPADYVVATGQAHSVADLAREAFACVGVEDWRAHVEVDPALARPADPHLLVGDPAKARRELGWAPTVDFAGMVARMVQADITSARSVPDPPPLAGSN
ncbi:MAG: GDP-mannose 4,6-dehydratase [Bifidobacteriaceae bacterium]|jgi:GDPmannose 4,6-dehydratase|nr:GDP-mannose 4,6-dehydratase [Bifidobacteriaceae bacterium]